MVAKVNNIDASGFVLKTKYDTAKSNLEKETSDAVKKTDISGLVKKANYKAKITEEEVNIYSISGLATTSVLNPVENNNLMLVIQSKKTDHDAEISGIKSKYFTTVDYNRFTNEKLDLKLKKQQQ